MHNAIYSVSTLYTLSPHNLFAVVTVSLTEEFVFIAEGDTGSFCAAIEDPMVELDREVTVFLFTIGDTAEGELHIVKLFC